MPTTDFTAWLPEVLPNVPDCPEVLAVNAVRNACIDFCNETTWWQGDYGTVPLAAADLPYAFAPPVGVQVIQIMSASIEGRLLGATDIDTLDSRVVGWRNAEGEPRVVFRPALGEMDLYPRPAGTDSYDVFLRAAYAPLRAATDIDDAVFEAYMEEIAAGALSKLLSIPGRPWTNADSAAYYDNIFKAGRVQAAIEASRSYGRGQKQVQFRNY